MRNCIFECLFVSLLFSSCATLRGTGDLGVVVEREAGSIQIIETTEKTKLGLIGGLGDLSHASVVFSRDGRFAYVFGRDGGLTKIDLLKTKIVKRILQSGNSIGGAISQDGRYVAVSNYEPGGVKIFRSDDLSLVAEIEARNDEGKLSKVVGLVDAPDNQFVFSLFEAGEIWVAKMAEGGVPEVHKFRDAGREPYDGFVTPEGRYYLAGLFGEDGISMVDLWDKSKGVKRILPKYGKGEQKLPVFKMPHFEAWAVSGNLAFVPGVGHHEVVVVDTTSWTEKKRIALSGQPVFAMASPDGRKVWVNFAMPDNDKIQIIDVSTLSVVETLSPGKAVLHMEFTPKGEQVWISVRDENRIDVYSTEKVKKLKSLSVDRPSGIFFSSRANRIGL
ncbi:MAG: protein nirF [Bdellovibrionales bacterium]|nr:protein nirF [Bdellovibrionales bacterium]